MTRTVFAGRHKLLVPEGWTTFWWQGRRYRLADLGVEFWSDLHHDWVPSIRLTTSAPKGQAGA